MRTYLILFIGVLATGCVDVCDLANCATGGGGGGTSTTNTGGASGSGGQGGSTTTGLPDECDPLALMGSASIAATCGLFVEPGATGGDGTPTTPYGTLAAALAAPNPSGAIYVCATADALDESAALTSPLNLLGGLECGTWTKSASKSSWTAPANTPVFSLEAGASGSLVQGFAVTARDATGFEAAALQGHSSIAVVVDGATATLRDVDLVAGAGAAGGDGLDQTGQADGRQSNPTAFDGNGGGACGMPAGSDKLATCGAMQSIGGGGGTGALGTGNGGAPGSPDPALGEPNGTAGLGDTGVVGWSCGSNGGNGEVGHDGPATTPGPGGTATGTLDASTLYVGAPGTGGPNGSVGQGGGGGGGRKGNGANSCGAGVAGPSGGGGGAGGCGGLGGGAGGAGGASIALVSLGATLTLENVTLSAAAGGAGGAGGEGQLGGNGGNGANGGGNACQGGSGGSGAAGAPGGGGAGGPSLGLAYTGTAPAIDDAAITIASTAAPGGAGGTGGLAGASWPLETKHAF